MPVFRKYFEMQQQYFDRKYVFLSFYCNVFLSFYLNIVCKNIVNWELGLIAILCAKMSSVYKSEQTKLNKYFFVFIGFSRPHLAHGPYVCFRFRNYLTVVRQEVLARLIGKTITNGRGSH